MFDVSMETLQDRTVLSFQVNTLQQDYDFILDTLSNTAKQVENKSDDIFELATQEENS